MTSSRRRVSFGVPHMEWNEHANSFEKKAPSPSPRINVIVKLMSEAHEKFGIHCNKILPPKTMSAITDSGCQTTSAGINVLRELNIPERFLIPTRHCIVGITDTRLELMGALLLEIKFRDRTTHQMVYISSNSCGLYLSEKALKELGILNEDFPNAMDIEANANAVSAQEVDESESTCSCIPRQDAPEAPESIPFEPIPQNTEKLRLWLLERFAASAFNTCTHQPLKEMTGAPMKITFKDEYTPHAMHVPLPIPHHWKAAVKKDIDRDVRLGIIEPVPQGTPSTWIARMVVTPKKNGKPRRTVDLQQLKKATLRETHYTPTPFAIVCTTPANTYKTVLDAWNGYHSMPLADDAKDATTFITEWGRYRYKRAPMGFHASGDAYTRRFDDITHEFERVSRCVDDSLLWDYDIEGAFWHTYEYLKHCSNNGIVFNADKFVFAKEQCEFAGFEITRDGYRPPKRVLDAIQGFPTPKSITDVGSWFGLVNQVAYAFAQAEVMSPFRDLLSKKHAKFYWDDALNQVFEESKEKIISLIKDGVKTYQKDRVTCLATDYSKQGIGYTLSQKYCNCPKPWTPMCGKDHWRLTLAGSRFTKPAESRYAPIEGEALAVAYGLQQCRTFIMGAPNLVVAVDHKPLLGILNDRSLGTIENPRVQRLKEKTLMYTFDIVHVEGKKHCAPDATSRYPTSSTPVAESNEVQLDCDGYAKAYAMTQSESLPSSLTWTQVNDSAAYDEECVALKGIIENGFPVSRDCLPEDLKYYWSMRDDLYVIDNVPFKGRKMLIPRNLRKQVIEGLHAANQGVTGMLANARERLFWPGLDADVKQKRLQCRQCNENAPSQPDEPMITTPKPELPFQQTVSDLYQLGSHHYLLYADRYSGWTEVAKISNSSAKHIKRNMLEWFKAYGVPEEISSDGGPPYNSSEYDSFLKSWGVSKRLSSAYYPQSNGRAEVAVKTMKRTLAGNVNALTGEIDTEQAARAILTHRNTPNQESGFCPAELLFGFKLRDHLPNMFRSLRKEWEDIRNAKELATLNRRAVVKGNHILEPLKEGECVSIQNQVGNRPKKWNNTGRIMEVLPNRQYRVMVDGSRRVTLRNRKFLRKILSTCTDLQFPQMAVRKAVVPRQPVKSPFMNHVPSDTRQQQQPTLRDALTPLPHSPPMLPERMAGTPTASLKTPLKLPIPLSSSTPKPSRRVEGAVPRRLNRAPSPDVELTVHLPPGNTPSDNATLDVQKGATLVLPPPRRSGRNRNKPKRFIEE